MRGDNRALTQCWNWRAAPLPRAKCRNYWLDKRPPPTGRLFATAPGNDAWTFLLCPRTRQRRFLLLQQISELFISNRSVPGMTMSKFSYCHCVMFRFSSLIRSVHADAFSSNACSEWTWNTSPPTIRLCLGLVSKVEHKKRTIKNVKPRTEQIMPTMNPMIILTPTAFSTDSVPLYDGENSISNWLAFSRLLPRSFPWLNFTTTETINGFTHTVWVILRWINAAPKY